MITQPTTSSLKALLENFEKSNSIKFKPTRDFYTQMKIGQKRFWLIIEGVKSPSIDELRAICSYFKADIKEYVN